MDQEIDVEKTLIQMYTAHKVRFISVAVLMFTTGVLAGVIAQRFRG